MQKILDLHAVPASLGPRISAGDSVLHRTHDAFKMRRMIILLLVAMLSRTVRAFDMRHHLSTKTRYAWKVPIPGAPSIYSTPDPEGYEPLHMWLMARHGTRWPTKDRMEQVGTGQTGGATPAA